MNDNRMYWIALQNILGYGSVKISQILEQFDDIYDLFDAKIKRKDVKYLSDKEYKALTNPDFHSALEVLYYCEDNNIQIITLDDEAYPNTLKRISAPPAVLYVRGRMPNFDEEFCVSMVGTRKSSLNGNIVASTLAYRLAQAGAIVISGGADGIDTKCTQGALFAKAPSVIVRPCGVDNPYLKDPEIEEARNKVALTGALISEVQPLEGIKRNAFHVRNRLLAALCQAVVVVECPAISGVQITVSHALEYGKEIYVVPGDISDERYVGSNKMLYDGATPVYSPYDVLQEYMSIYPHKLNANNARILINEDDIYLGLQKKYSKPVRKNKTQVAKVYDFTKSKPVGEVLKVSEPVKWNETNEPKESKILPEETESEIKLVYSKLKHEAITFDQICKETELDASTVMYAITELEIEGFIEALPGNKFILKN